MPTRFVNIDRETPMLLPCDLREWVSEDDLVHFVIDAVNLLPLTALAVNRRGTGSEQFPPRMMLSLLIYSYASGVLSSRAIEAATYHDLRFRYLCANTHPDHSTICAFRSRNEALLTETFVQVLQLASEMKLLRLGTVALDGTKIQANASKHQAVSYERAEKQLALLKDEVAQLLDKAQQADSRPLRAGLSIPEEIARRAARRQRLEEAQAAIRKRAQEQQARDLAKRQAKYEATRARRQERQERGEKVGGREPQEPQVREKPLDGEQYNFTDPESRIMAHGKKSVVQGYNAQAVVETQSLLIVGQHVVNAPNDQEQLVPGLHSIPEPLGKPAAVLADTGYFSAAQLETVEAEGVRTYVAPARGSHGLTIADLEAPDATSTVEVADEGSEEVSDEEVSSPEAMRRRLDSEEGKAQYRLRKQTVEPVLGIIKECLGFRRFSLRGHAKVSLEWLLVSVAWNFKRLHKLVEQGEKSLPTARMA